MTTYDLVTALDEHDVRAVFDVYDAVFGDLPDYGRWRGDIWDRHAARAGFRLARAREGDRLVGFGYGYTGERGQWWTDHVAAVLGADTAAAWLGGHFEVVSVGVLPADRGRGAGLGLMRTLTRDLPHERWLLMTTADADDPARHLYAREGWQVVGPGLRAGQVVLGRRRPTGS